jgi:hypothetical protein
VPLGDRVKLPVLVAGRLSRREAFIYLGLYRGRAEGFVEHHKGLVGSGGITVEAHNARLLKQIFKNLEKGSA